MLFTVEAAEAYLVGQIDLERCMSAWYYLEVRLNLTLPNRNIWSAVGIP